MPDAAGIDGYLVGLYANPFTMLTKLPEGIPNDARYLLLNITIPILYYTSLNNPSLPYHPGVSLLKEKK